MGEKQLVTSMKKRCTFGMFFLFVTLSISAQDRGFRPIVVKVENQNTTVYKQSHALVIGISQYPNGWADLDGVVRDVIKVKETLEKQDFNVEMLLNLNLSQLDSAYRTFINKYGQGSENRLLFYFAGHGYTVTNSDGSKLGYIVPSNAPTPTNNTRNFQANAMEMNSIFNFARQIKSKHALFLFDACFSGQLFNSDRSETPDIIKYKTSEPVRQFITSGGENETVPDESIFCSQFIEALTTDKADIIKDGYLTGTELGEYLQTNVVNMSNNRQHPQYGKISDFDLSRGDFIFKLKTSSSNNNQNNNNSYVPTGSGTIVDSRDGQSYNWVNIGGQVWLAQNLNFNATNSWSYENSVSNLYGRLYTWDAAQNACPAGWHLPSDDEWKQLEMSIGMMEYSTENMGLRGTQEGSKIKASEGWSSGGGGTNSSKLNILAGGFKPTQYDNFTGKDYFAYYWTSTTESAEFAMYRKLYYGHNKIHRHLWEKDGCFSVRCVKD